MKSYFIKISRQNETYDQICKSVNELSIVDESVSHKFLYHRETGDFVSHSTIKNIDWSRSRLDQIRFFIDPKTSYCDYNHNMEQFIANICNLGEENELQVTVFACVR